MLFRALGTLALALAVWAPAQAASSANVDIHVSINASKSLAVDSTTYDFGALSVNTSSVSATAVTVTNNSGSLIETYTLQGADALSTGGGVDWTLGASPTVNGYALQAQFGAARPADSDASWTADALNATAIVCDATTLGNGTASESGAAVMPGQARQLWIRIKTPTVVSDTTPHKATLTLAVQ